VAVQHPPLETDPLPERPRSREDVVALASERHREVGAGGLRRGLAEVWTAEPPRRRPRGGGAHAASSRSNGVIFAPRSTMSHRQPVAQFSTLTSCSMVPTSGARACAGTALEIGASGSSGSPSKSFWVPSRLPSDVPSREKWMWAGRQALGWLPHG